MTSVHLAHPTRHPAVRPGSLTTTVPRRASDTRKLLFLTMVPLGCVLLLMAIRGWGHGSDEEQLSEAAADGVRR